MCRFQSEFVYKYECIFQMNAMDTTQHETLQSSIGRINREAGRRAHTNMDSLYLVHKPIQNTPNTLDVRRCAIVRRVRVLYTCIYTYLVYVSRTTFEVKL